MYRLFLVALGEVSTRAINRLLLPRGRLEGVDARCEGTG